MFYPSWEIVKVDYTSGIDFVDKKTKNYYTGYYYKTSDGKFFSGKEYTRDTVELESAAPSKNFVENTKSYEYYHAMPTSNDYQAGFFIRYVLKRVNGDLSTMSEISEKNFSMAKKDPLYLAESFKWRLTGPLYTTKEGVPGVVNTNQKTLDQLEPKMPGVKKYFVDLAQYAK